mmetsp:Transcript_24727/g.60749  ORF Transcript_24727/g.60749 Transcript_24727/m.60749 type:complete len:373 (+) Transcript_24727:488-1606(+)
MLSRIHLPSVTEIGICAFFNCRALVEANLSTASIVEIPFRTFFGCHNLQTVSLPNTLERIESSAFAKCYEMVTVAIPLDSQPIKVSANYVFSGCKSLANLVIPKDSVLDPPETRYYRTFEEAALLQERLGGGHLSEGRKSLSIVAGLVARFDGFPVHRLCYGHSSITAQELQQSIEDQVQVESYVDKFGMTALHILFSSIGPSEDLLEVLVDVLPYYILDWKDANGKRPLDYLLANWTDKTASLLRATFRIWMIDPMRRWGATSWVEDMTSRVEEIFDEGDKERSVTLCNRAYRTFEEYQKLEVTSILEMALWKMKLKCGRSDDGTKRLAVDRGDCRCVCGSEIVIPNVVTFLDIHMGVDSSSCQRHAWQWK